VRKRHYGSPYTTEKKELTLSEEALILHNKVLQLDSPGSRALEVFKAWFNRKKPFAGKGNKLMENDDIAALRPSQGQDRLSKTLQKRVGWMFREKRPVPPSWGEMVYFSEKHLTRAVQILSVLFLALALTGAIIALHYIAPTGWRFGALGGFLLTFALAVGTLTNATTPEMFAATAAYVSPLGNILVRRVLTYCIALRLSWSFSLPLDYRNERACGGDMCIYNYERKPHAS
jgi:drug/metabolite transporter superfamily protein YnfA